VKIRAEENPMIHRPRPLAWSTLGALLLSLPALAVAQPFYYPDKGQSPQQQEADKGQCYSWAVQQSGFDPAQAARTPAPAPPPQQQVTGSGARVRGAAGGAAIGAVGGAIGGDAGKGAAIGAASGALIGGVRKRSEIQAQNQAYQNQVAQQQGAMAQGQANYDRAFAACMGGRGYSVR
jgi:YmgG-like glycine-zipper protein